MKRISYRSLPLRPVFSIVLLTLLSNSNLTGQFIQTPTSQERPAEETDIYLVTFQTGTPASERAGVVQASGALLRRTFTSANAVSVQVPNTTALSRLRNHPRVISVFANRPITLAAPGGTAQGKGKGGGGNGGGSGGNGAGGNGGNKPKVPGNLAATSISSSDISLAWTDKSNNELGFAIERCAGAGCGDFSEIVQVGADTSSYVDSGLASESIYRYRVMAFNAPGNSKYSNTAEAATDPAPPTPPPAPSNLTTTVLSAVSFQINLDWLDNSSNEDGFGLERCTGGVAGCGDTDFLQIVQLGANVNSHTDTGLQAETTYTYRLHAFNASGASAYSNSSEAVTPAPAPSTQAVPSGVWRIGATPGMLSVTGAGVGVAVVDTGLDFSHPDLGLDSETAGVNAFNAFGGSCQDFFGHGTHVGGTIAARDNLIDVVGVAPDATLYCVNVFMNDPVEGVIATDESLMAGLDWIATNANVLTPPIRVVNMSLGRPRTPGDDDPNHPLHLTVKALYDSGISVVVAAGNDPLQEAIEQVPASYREVIAVASTTALSGINGYDEFFGPCVGVENITADTASYFTTDGAFIGGTGVTVSAPGEQQENIFSYLGDCYLDPMGILSTAMGGGTEQLFGTSMAAPHVAGVVALMWEVELDLGSSLAPENARTRIRNTVDRPGTAPLDSPIVEYTFDGEREGVIWAPAAVGDAPAPTADLPPTVSILSPASGASFADGVTITFEGTADDPEDGNLSSSLVWTSTRDGQIGTGSSFSRTLSSGNHIVTASATDSGQNLATASVSITVGSSSEATTVQVSSIVYNEAGNNLIVTVGLSNEFGNPVEGAAVSVELIEWFYTLIGWTFSGTTDSQGNLQFQLNSAPIGCYLTDVQSIDAPGLTWMGGTPSNYYCK